MVDKFLLIQVLKSLVFSYKRIMIAFISVFIAAMMSAAFLNIYFDIDIKLSKELKSYGSNFIISSKSGKIPLAKYEQLKQKLNNPSLTPYLYSYFNLGSQNGVVLGTNFKALKLTRPHIQVLNGGFSLSDFKSNYAFIGVDLAKQMQVKIGDTINVFNEKNQRLEHFILKGILQTGGVLDGVLIIDLKKALALRDAKSINYIQSIQEGNFNKLSSLAKKLSTDGLQARPIASVSLSEGALLKKIELLMAFISFIILFITSLSVQTTLSAIILARKKEIALALALGASKKAIIKQFVLELLILCLAASISGALAGYFLANILGFMIFNSPITFRLISFFMAIILSLIFTVLASLFPLKSIFNINICANLKGE